VGSSKRSGAKRKVKLSERAEGTRLVPVSFHLREVIFRIIVDTSMEATGFELRTGVGRTTPEDQCADHHKMA